MKPVVTEVLDKVWNVNIDHHHHINNMIYNFAKEGGDMDFDEDNYVTLVRNIVRRLFVEEDPGDFSN